jgi:hypothetical protein
MEKIKSRINGNKMILNNCLKEMGFSIDCPKCGNIAKKIPLRKLAFDIRDFLSNLNVFHCFAYCCDYCKTSDVEVLTYY